MTASIFKVLVATFFLVGIMSARLTILGAAYGRSDVSSQVRAAIEGNSLSIEASNDVLGDSFFGNKKALVIVYQRDNNEPEVLITPEGRIASIVLGMSDSFSQNTHNLRHSRHHSKDSEILGAAYGLADVTQQVQTLVDQGAEEIDAENSVFGDSWPNTKKTLVVVYSSPSGYPKVKIAVEGECIETYVFGAN